MIKTGEAIRVNFCSECVFRHYADCCSPEGHAELASRLAYPFVDKNLRAAYEEWLNRLLLGVRPSTDEIRDKRHLCPHFKAVGWLRAYLRGLIQ